MPRRTSTMRTRRRPLFSLVTAVPVALTVTAVALADGSPAPTPSISAVPTPAPAPAPAPTLAVRGTCGVGACRRPVPAVGRCVPGTPVVSGDAYGTTADPVNHSWDLDCDGKVTKEPLPAVASGYVAGCATAEPQQGQCVPKPVAAACGQKVPLFDKCKLIGTGPSAFCKANDLKGEFTQGCR